MNQEQTSPRRTLRRTAALLLCCALFAGVFSLRMFAAPAAPKVPLSVAQTMDRGEMLQKQPDVYFRTYVGFFSFLYEPTGKYFYVADYPWQHGFGFSKAYDDMAWTMNCYVDTIRCKFVYDDREWLVQMWKGGYGIFLFTGGEIGLYSRPLSRKIEHYDSAKPEDWIGMEIRVYNNGVEKFHRPMKSGWWSTGFAWGTANRLLQKPRYNVVLEGTLVFRNTQMASLFANSLQSKGFAQKKAVSLGTPETYTVSGQTVHFFWSVPTETWY